MRLVAWFKGLFATDAGTEDLDAWYADFDRRIAERARLRAEKYSLPEIAPLRPIGRDDGRCPYCEEEFFPKLRGPKDCTACGRKVYMRQRPFDGRKVLLRDEDLAELEGEWSRDYEIKARAPRAPSPESIAIRERMLKAGPSPIALVETTAQQIFREFFARPNESPEHVLSEGLRAVTNDDIRLLVESRVRELQAQYMG